MQIKLFSTIDFVKPNHLSDWKQRKRKIKIVQCINPSSKLHMDQFLRRTFFLGQIRSLVVQISSGSWSMIYEIGSLCTSYFIMWMDSHITMCLWGLFLWVSTPFVLSQFSRNRITFNFLSNYTKRLKNNECHDEYCVSVSLRVSTFYHINANHCMAVCFSSSLWKSAECVQSVCDCITSFAGVWRICSTRNRLPFCCFAFHPFTDNSAQNCNKLLPLTRRSLIKMVWLFFRTKTK